MNKPVEKGIAYCKKHKQKKKLYDVMDVVSPEVIETAMQLVAKEAKKEVFDDMDAHYTVKNHPYIVKLKKKHLEGK